MCNVSHVLIHKSPLTDEDKPTPVTYVDDKQPVLWVQHAHPTITNWYLLFTCFTTSLTKSSSLGKTEVETGQHISYPESSSAPGSMYQDPNTIERKAAPTGDMYALPEKSVKHKQPANHLQQQAMQLPTSLQQQAMELPTSPQQQAMELPTYQDPNTIQRQAAATGDMYALPEKISRIPKQPSGPAPALYTEVDRTNQVSTLFLCSTCVHVLLSVWVEIPCTTCRHVHVRIECAPLLWKIKKFLGLAYAY